MSTSPYHTFQFEILSKFQTRVDHAPDSECNGTNAQIETSKQRTRFLLFGFQFAAAVFCSNEGEKIIANYQDVVAPIERSANLLLVRFWPFCSVTLFASYT